MATNLVVTDYMIDLIDGAVAGLCNGIPTYLGLYRNDVTPDRATVLADLTEADWASYGRLAMGGWTPATVVAHLGLIVQNPQVFVYDGTGGTMDIYGYFVVDNSGHLLWVQRDPSAPTTLSLSSPFYAVAPRFSAYSQFP